MASINFGPETGITASAAEAVISDPTRVEYLDKLQTAIDYRLGWDGQDRTQLQLPGEPGCSYNEPGVGGIGSDYLRDRRTLHVSRFLDSNIKLWVWDFDDTLINSRAYIWHAMDPWYIKEMTDEQLSRDFPYWRYWRRLVLYLVQSGKRVGIASFGYYPIIKAYMDRVFGPNQHIFDANNIHSVARGASGERDWGNMPVNKNAYIQRLMLYYKVPSPQQVLFFDDRASNIGDALRMGVVAIQVSHRYDRDGRVLDCRDLFGPQTMIQVSRQLQSGECIQALRDTVNSPQFSWLGDRKVWKYQAQRQGFEDARRLIPNPEVGGVSDGKFVWDTPEGFTNIATADASDPELAMKMRKQQIIDAVLPRVDTSVLEGFRSPPANSTSARDKRQPVCMDCQNPVTNWIIVVVFLAMVGLIAGLIIWG